MNLADVSAFEVARLAAAAAFGWGLVSAFWGAVTGVVSAMLARQVREHIGPITIRVRDDDNTPPGPPASA